MPLTILLSSALLGAHGRLTIGEHDLPLYIWYEMRNLQGGLEGDNGLAYNLLGRNPLPKVVEGNPSSHLP